MLSVTYKQFRLSVVMLNVVAPFDVPLMPDLYFQLYSGQSKNTLGKNKSDEGLSTLFLSNFLPLIHLSGLFGLCCRECSENLNIKCSILFLLQAHRYRKKK